MLDNPCGSGNDTDQAGCLKTDTGDNIQLLSETEWLEETVWNGMRKWHVIFLSIGAAVSVVILLCCCFKFRIPRTKQEIEGDYVRRRIMRKFRKRLKAIQNQELDEMDLKKALDKIRTELKSDTESLQQSDVLSGATLSSAGGVVHPLTSSTYRRASQIQIEISLEDLRIHSMGIGGRVALAFNRFFGRKQKRLSLLGDVPNDANNENSGENQESVLPKNKKNDSHSVPKQSSCVKEANTGESPSETHLSINKKPKTKNGDSTKP